MIRVATLVSLIALCCAPVAPAQETPIEAPVSSIGMFKNGLAIVRRTVQVPSAGVYRLDDVPSAVHGTFWIESSVPVVAQSTMREVDVPFGEADIASLQGALAGKTVRVRYKDPELGSREGQVIGVRRPTGDGAWSRSYDPYYATPWYASGTLSALRPALPYLILKGPGERVAFVDQSSIAEIDVLDAGPSLKQRKPVLLLTVDQAPVEPTTITLSYLTRGMAWAPAYRVRMGDDQRLTIEQHAVIKNELTDLDDGAELMLISGYPSIAFGHVSSPLSLQTTWAQFFAQLNARPGQPNNVMVQQAVMSNRAADVSEPMPAAPVGEGTDLHYQSIGRRRMNEGDALSLVVGSGQADYERLVQWTVRDQRSESGHYPNRSYADHVDDPEDGPWDAIRFDNPLPFPMTTAPVMFIDRGQFAGQQMATWTAQGERATLRINRALSIRTAASEQEEPGDREVVVIGGNDYRRTNVKGELKLTNGRNEPTTIVIRRHFSGELLSADEKPTVTLLEEGVRFINPRNELTWTLTLAPGESKSLGYRYSVLVDQ